MARELTTRELIQRYGLKLAEKNGIRGFMPTERIKEYISKMDYLVTRKPEIMVALDEIAADQKARWQAAADQLKTRETEYLKTADLRRCLVYCRDENYRESRSIETLVYLHGCNDAEGKKSFYTPEFGRRYIEIAHTTKTVDELIATATTGYGFDGVAVEITPEQEAQILAEQEVAIAVVAEEAAQKAAAAAEKKAKLEKAREMDRAARFAKAKQTGKPVEIRHWSEDCNDPKEECSLDIVSEWALPDGTTSVRRQHTW